MKVVEYGTGSIGAGSADLFSNQRGSAGLRAKWLWHDPATRNLKIAFDDGLDDAESMTLHVGDLSVGFPENSGGDSSFTIGGVDVSWTDGDTLAARVSKPVSTDATLTIGIAGGSGTEGDDDAIEFSVTLDEAGTETVSVDYQTSDGSAEAGSDYTAKSGTLTFDAGKTSKTVSVAIADDTDDESDETFTITLSNASGADLGSATATGTIRNRTVVVETTPTVSIAGGSGTEGDDDEIEFTVTLDEAASGSVTVDYATSDGTAAAGDDYTAKSGTLSFSTGSTTKTITVPIADDETDESDETFTITLSNASGAELGTRTATGTIHNRAVAVGTTPTLSITGGRGKEGDEASITFTIRLDKAASGSVNVDYATADGTAEAGDDYTAKSGTLTFGAGETSKTIRVDIADDVVNESDETFTVTLSNASGADLGTSTATGTIENRRVEPLTARFEVMPAEHDGSEFTFELHFSENPEVPYKRLRDRSFTLDEADIVKAKRKNPQSADKNKSWTITVEPDGNDRISITLPAGVSCTDDKSICTSDGRKLSHSTSATVQGPVGISVGDVEVEEGAGVVLAFQVALTRAASSALTVDYSTSDGTATAGADYTSTSGTLTIGAGSSSGTVEVSVIDDEHNEGSETFTLTLSNPSSGNLTDASATGTITNHDALPAALVARFGRTAALHVVEQVEGARQRAAGAGLRRPRRRPADQSEHGPGLRTRLPAAARRRLRDAAGWRAVRQRRRHDVQSRAAGSARATGSDIAGSARAAGSDVAGSDVAGPGPAARRRVRPRDGRARPGAAGLRIRAQPGDVDRGRPVVLEPLVVVELLRPGRRARAQRRRPEHDVRRRLLQGPDGHRRVAVAHARPGRLRRRRRHRPDDLRGHRALYPWVGFKASERVTVWTVAGYGAGGLLLNPGAGAPIETGLSMAMAAGGGRGELMTSETGFELAFKADALWVGTRTDAASGASGNLKATRAGVTRLRTALEGSKSTTIAARMAFTPSVEVGIRQDSGDAEVGRGLDVGLGLVLADGVTGLAVDVRIRRLLVHQAAGFAESGMSVSVSYDPTPKTPLGFTARVSPAWGGDAMSGAEALWGRESMGGMGQDRLLGGGGDRLDTEVGYGLPIGARFVGTPRVGLRTSEYGRDYRVGYGMQVLEQGGLNLELGIDAERRESPVFHLQEQAGGTDQRVLGRATVQW